MHFGCRSGCRFGVKFGVKFGVCTWCRSGVQTGVHSVYRFGVKSGVEAEESEVNTAESLLAFLGCPRSCPQAGSCYIVEGVFEADSAPVSGIENRLRRSSDRGY